MSDPIPPEVAALLAEPEPALKEVTFTDLRGKRRRHERDGRRGMTADHFHETRKPAPIGFLNRSFEPGAAATPRPGNPWEGPRFSFTWLVGECRIWPEAMRLPDGRCALCRGADLPAHAYCLGCDATGKDALIPAPSREDLARRSPPKCGPGRLRGGRGKAAGETGGRKGRRRAG